MGVVGDGRAACHIRRVVHASLHELLVVVRDLVGVVVGERHRKAPPGLAILMPGLDLARLDSRVREYERLRLFVGIIRSLSPLATSTGCVIPASRFSLLESGTPQVG